MSQDSPTPPGSVGAAGTVTVNGETIRKVLDGVPTLPDDQMEKTHAIFEARGIENVTADAWYSQEAWLAALEDLTVEVGSHALRSLGRHVPKTTVWPSDVTTVLDAIASIDAAYRMNHRGPELGAYTFERTDDHRGRVTTSTAYPCPFDVGIVEGVIREFSPTVTTTAMAFVHEVSEPCRGDGGDQCTYAVRW